jgi:hypothetical protein
MRHPDVTTEWMLTDGGPRCVDSGHPPKCIHDIELYIPCAQCPIDWHNYATNNGGL